MFKMVDVCSGKMTLNEAQREVFHYMFKSPKRLIVDIQLKSDGYHVTIWMNKVDFKKKC